MAKSSLTFSERRKVLTLGSNADHAVRTLTKQDCGKVIVLTNLQGHAITLPTAASAGEGWNCRFIVGTAHNDRSVRDSSSIAAQGSETLSLVTSKNGGSLAAGVAAVAEALDLDSCTDSDVFTITVPVAAGGTGTTFTFTFKANDAALTAANAMTAGNFEISKEGTDEQIAAAVKALIDGDADTVPVTVRKPQSGEGIEGTGIQGLNASVTSGDSVTLTAVGRGAAGSTIALTEGVGDGIIGGATLADVAGDTLGVDRTTFLLDTRTILITESAAEGDMVEVVVINGEWQANSVSSL